jgi:hypothetical protein
MRRIMLGRAQEQCDRARNEADFGLHENVIETTEHIITRSESRFGVCSVANEMHEKSATISLSQYARTVAGCKVERGR